MGIYIVVFDYPGLMNGIESRSYISRQGQAGLQYTPDEIRKEAPWTMMFADDIVMCSEIKEHVEEKLESWKYGLERSGMKVNRRKTEYMCVNERQDNGSSTVKMQ